jgi:predicted nucleic acid-binding protein
MSAVDFLDSNVLVYVFDHVDERKSKIAIDIVSQGTSQRTLAISFQVVQETLNVITRKLKPPVPARDAQYLLGSTLMPLLKVYPSKELYTEALRVAERYGQSFYDSLIIASALSIQADRLLTEDMQHGQVIDGLKIVNPFL